MILVLCVFDLNASQKNETSSLDVASKIGGLLAVGYFGYKAVIALKNLLDGLASKAPVDIEHETKRGRKEFLVDNASIVAETPINVAAELEYQQKEEEALDELDAKLMKVQVRLEKRKNTLEKNMAMKPFTTNVQLLINQFSVSFSQSSSSSSTMPALASSSSSFDATKS